jgi:hypothetical protein
LEGIVIQVMPETEVDALEERLARGADLLFDMERRGDTDGEEYRRYLDHYVDLLQRYEGLAA